MMSRCTDRSLRHLSLDIFSQPNSDTSMRNHAENTGAIALPGGQGKNN
jgi:hypothetical protein